MPILRLIDRVVTRTSLWLAGISLCAAFAIGCVQVASRFVLHIPTTWSESALRLALVWCAFGALPAAIRSGSLLSVDFLDRTMARTRYYVVLRAFVAAATTAFLLVCILAGYEIATRLAFQTIAGLGISVAFAYAAIPVSAALALPSTLAAFLEPPRTDLRLQQ